MTGAFVFLNHKLLSEYDDVIFGRLQTTKDISLQFYNGTRTLVCLFFLKEKIDFQRCEHRLFSISP